MPDKNFAIVICLLLLLPRCASAEKYSDYIDPESGVVKKPEGGDWSDPYGDGVWRSGWFYASLIILRDRDQPTYESMSVEHGVSVDDAAKFMTYMRDHNISGNEWTLPKNSGQKFSRDQLIPLMYLLAVVHHDAPELRPLAKPIVKNLVRIVKANGAVSDASQGEVNPNLKYVVDVLADKYGIDYVDGNTRGLYKAAFTTALTADSIQVQLPGDAATTDDYSVFNRLGLVTLQCVLWGRDDSDVKKWRRNYRQHADAGWGPAFRLVSGRSLDSEEIEKYRSQKIKRSQDNDILLGQRPRKYLSGRFPPHDGDEDRLVLDYVVLKALSAVWQ